MKYSIPAGAKKILTRLNQNGYEAYLVGGCVRDLLRGTSPHDWDICTSALPEEVEDSFAGSRIIETGLKHGTVTIMQDGEGYEVTTYRVDGEYSDGRRPDSVQFVSSLTDDLARRDFTMNAIAMDVNGVIQDPFGGHTDILSGTVRCVGNSAQRFQEDGLRVLRALRFASAFGFRIVDETSRAIHACRSMLEHVAAERINTELCKLLLGCSAGDILINYVDVLSVFWTELMPMVGFEQYNPWHCYDVWGHTVRAVESAPADTVLRLTMLLHDIGKPDCFILDENGVGHFYGHPAKSAELADKMLLRLKFDNSTRKQVVDLVFHHDAELTPRSKIIRRWLNRIGEDRFFQLLEVKRADNMAQRQDMVQARLLELEKIKNKAEEVLAEQQCFMLKDLAIGGRDVVACGIAPGPDVGAALNRIMDKVIDGELLNDRQTLLDYLMK